LHGPPVGGGLALSDAGKLQAWILRSFFFTTRRLKVASELLSQLEEKRLIFWGDWMYI